VGGFHAQPVARKERGGETRDKHREMPTDIATYQDK
jgi:hypothetical protein